MFVEFKIINTEDIGLSRSLNMRQMVEFAEQLLHVVLSGIYFIYSQILLPTQATLKKSSFKVQKS